MVGRFWRVGVAATSFCLIASRVPAQFPPITDPTKEEAKCEFSTGKTLVWFTSVKAKCVGTCIATWRMNNGPYAGCFGPGFTDLAANACVYGPVQGVEAKARAAIVTKCNVAGQDSCPECYPAGQCGTGNPIVNTVESLIDTVTEMIYCLERAELTPTKAQAKCEDGVANTLAKFARLKTKCYEKCNRNMMNGKIASGSCSPPFPADPATQACIFAPLKGAEARAAAAIDKVCANVPGATPPCYVPSFDTGVEWANWFEGLVDFTTSQVACGAPSGAFLN